MFYFDNTIILLIPAILFTLYAQMKVRNAFNHFQKIRSSSGLKGNEAAYDFLRRSGINDVSVDVSKSFLGDHYDPRSKVVRLSEQNYANSSIAALAVAAHEVGHAIQHAREYPFLKFRTALFPVANWGSNLAIPLFFVGLIFSMPPLLDIGIILFTFAVGFQLITLPVEFNASKRALVLLQSGGYLRPEEIDGAKKVLNAAALTYVAAAAMAVLTLLRLLILRGDE